MKANKKYYIVVVALLLVTNCYSQSVPNTTTFDLDTVVSVVNPTTDDLQDCFNDAISSYFNPTYEGSKNSLLNFRDYGSHNAGFPDYVSNGGIASSDGTTFNVSYPSGVVSGDVLVMIIAADTLNAYPTISGWNFASVQNTENGGYAVYLRATTGSLSGSVTVSKTSYSKCFGIIMRFSNASGWSDYAGTSVGEYCGAQTGTISPDATQLGCIVSIYYSTVNPTITPYDMDIDLNISSSDFDGIRFILRTATDGSHYFEWSSCPTDTFQADIRFNLDE